MTLFELKNKKIEIDYHQKRRLNSGQAGPV